MEHYIHFLFGFALYQRFAKNKLNSVTAFLYCFVVSGIYDLVDKYVFNPLIYLGFLPEHPLFVHRSITHTIWFLLLLSLVAYILLGSEYFKLTFLIGFFAHLLPDMFSGSVQILKPLTYHVFSFPQFPLAIDVICVVTSLALLRKEITLKLTKTPE